jgi:serine carboxypeptidase-like clade 4
MQWSGQKEFNSSVATPYLVDSEEAGTLKSHGPLAFLKVCVLRMYYCLY